MRARAALARRSRTHRRQVMYTTASIHPPSSYVWLHPLTAVSAVFLTQTWSAEYLPVAITCQLVAALPKE